MHYASVVRSYYSTPPHCNNYVISSKQPNNNLSNNNEVNNKLISLVTTAGVLPCFDSELIINRPSPPDVIQ